MATRLGNRARAPLGGPRAAYRQGAARATAFCLRRRDDARGGRVADFPIDRTLRDGGTPTITVPLVRELDAAGVPGLRRHPGRRRKHLRRRDAQRESSRSAPARLEPDRGRALRRRYSAAGPRRPQRSGKRRHAAALRRRLWLRGSALRRARCRSVPSQGRPRLHGGDLPPSGGGRRGRPKPRRRRPPAGSDLGSLPRGTSLIARRRGPLSLLWRRPRAARSGRVGERYANARLRPDTGGAESLSAGVAGSIALYEATPERRYWKQACQESVSRPKKSRLPALKVAWYTQPTSSGPPRSRRLRRRLQAHGNVQSLLEALRPNGFDRRLSRVSKAARGPHQLPKYFRPHNKVKQRFWRRPVT